MPKKGPGRCDRRGISWMELFELFPNEEAAERWWIASRWPNGVACPSCGSLDVQKRRTKKPQPYRCRSCRYDFSPKTGSLMQGSPLPYRTWVIAIYILTTGIKGTSSMKLHRDLKVSQKTAWFLAHRIRETWNKNNRMKPFEGPAEIDETYVGGRMKNMHSSRRQILKSHGTDNKMIVAGVKDRATGKVRATVVERADKKTLIPFVEESTVPGAKLFTDEAVVYHDLPNHESVTHSIGQYVDGQAHTNGVESFWALVKRGYHGTYHRMSHEHLHRYVNEFAGRHNDRPLDTIDQMAAIVRGSDRKRLKYADLIAHLGGGRAWAE